MSTKSVFFRLLLTLGTTIIFPVSIASAQTTPAKTGDQSEVAKAATLADKPREKVAPTPLYTQYRGVSIGMSADLVRNKMDHLKQKSDTQDFFEFSDKESAQVFYGKDDKVMAVSVNYAGKDSNPPSAKDVLGEVLQAKPDGSMYELKRYPAAGYWVSYSRTGGSDPLVSITIQKTSPSP